MAGKLKLVGILWSKVQLDALDITVEGKGKIVGLKMETDEGDMDIALWPEVAPNTAANIIMLAKGGFYDGLGFHRIIKGFMIQGGCPLGDGTGGPGFSLPAEFNDRHHEKGVFSMARSSDRDSAGSQFFLMHGKAPHLDGQYTAFGKVEKGLEVVDKIANLPTRPGGEGSTPVNVPKIKKVTVITLKAK
ncbi:MAG: peptidylprolyl isomerase [Planctomycetes bacterium]|nr:peptidylprolyl isomerase [Planctomycetota bacterium]